MSTPADESLIALTGLLSFVLIVALYVWTALALSAMFRKMGEEAWKGWVPVLNTATVLKWGGFSPWLVLLSFVPVVQIVVFVLLVISAHRINPGFGYGAGMTVLAALLFVVWASILGFGPARWLGARATARPAGAPGVSRPEPPEPAAAPAVRVVPVHAPYTTPLPVDRPEEADVLASRPQPESPATSAFAPPTAANGGWTPPETAPRAAPAAAPSTGVETPAAPPVTSTSAPAAAAPDDAASWEDASPRDEVADDDVAWPSEIDDVSAIHPSPYPPSSAAGRPYVAPPVGEDDGPIAFVPGRRTGQDAPPVSAPVTRVPAAPASRAAAAPTRSDRPATDPAAPTAAGAAAPAAPAAPAAAIFARPARSRRADDAEDPDAFPEMSGEVSAVIGSPTAGAPRSAAAAVSAQHRRVETGEDAGVASAPPAAPRVPERSAPDDDDLDETIIARRAVRATWEFVPATGSPVPLTAAVVILGRRPARDAAFPGAQLVAVHDDARTVSKTHARIEQRGDAWIVTDLGSTNGVLVRTLMGDEVEVEQGSQLDAGERFFLGDEEFHLRRIAP